MYTEVGGGSEEEARKKREGEEEEKQRWKLLFLKKKRQDANEVQVLSEIKPNACIKARQEGRKIMSRR